jgi:polysaccharide export outer membrane protein
VRTIQSPPIGNFYSALAALLWALVAATSWADTADYKLGSDDLLKINVFDHPELSIDARVSKSGNITFPLLGEMPVSGLSTRELEQLLIRRLDEGGYVHRAQASVLITEYQSQKIAVMGQVTKPGQYALTTTSKALDLLAQAGGPINGVAADEATLVRQNGTKVQIDLHALFEGDPAQNPAVSAGDSLYVPRAPLFYISGEVQRPGAYRLERQMTVAQAISAGGGLTPKGSVHWLKVKRRDGGGALREISIKERDLLRPDDVLTIKQGWF